MSAPRGTRRQPGHLLHAIARWIVDERTLLGVIEPTIADLQYEMSESAGSGRARRIAARLAGYLAFWRVIFVQLLPWRCAMDGRLALRMAAITLLAVLAYAFALQVLPVLSQTYPPLHLRARGSSLAWWEVFIGRSIAVTMPYALFAMALLFGRSAAAGERRRQVRSFIVVTGVAVLAVLAIDVWVLSVSRIVVWARPLSAGVWTGIDSLMGRPFVRPFPIVRPLIMGHQLRFQYPVACAIFALLGFALAPYLRTRIRLVVALLFVPPAFQFLLSYLPRLTLSHAAVLMWLLYAVLLCLTAWMLFRSRREGLQHL